MTIILFHTVHISVKNVHGYYLMIFRLRNFIHNTINSLHWLYFVYYVVIKSRDFRLLAISRILEIKFWHVRFNEMFGVSDVQLISVH
jgi:hypothetical protein